MDNNTAQLLEKLSQKLGTTTEYLWGILLKQARVDATLSVCIWVAALVLLFLLWRTHIKLSSLREPRNENSYRETGYDYYEEKAAIPMLVFACIVMGFFVGALINTPNIINGYSNPEYWALHEILSAAK